MFDFWRFKRPGREPRLFFVSDKHQQGREEDAAFFCTFGKRRGI